MTMIAVLVEGVTEEGFVNLVLQPALNPTSDAEGPWLRATRVTTSVSASGTRHKGGGSAWRHYERALKNLLGQPHWDRVALLMDLYAYPADAPGAGSTSPDCRTRHARVLAALRQQYPDRRFCPGILLHEFETLVIASAVGRASLLDDVGRAKRLQEVAYSVSDDVELLNDGPSTAPSKRVESCWPDYNKVLDGAAAVEEAGLAHIRALCPAFDDWVNGLTT